MNEHQHRRTPKRIMWLMVVALTVYAGVVGWFALKEDAFIYFPGKGLHSPEVFNIGIETVRLHTSDGVQLVCWSIPSRDPSDVWVLYLHGNGGTVSSRGYVEHYRAFRQMGVNTFALSYRGYGMSDGTPSEKGLYEDAQAAFDYLINMRAVPPHRIVIFGYSLGSAVATELAARVNAGAVVLEGAFMSAYRLGQEQYPFLPVSWMMKNRYDSMSRIHLVDEPKLFLHAVEDEIVPFEHGRALFAAAREPKTFVETAGGHNTAHAADSSLFYGSIARFLRQHRILN